jgi:hypothetical protein
MHGLLALAVHRCPPGHDPASGSGYMLVLEDVTTFSTANDRNKSCAMLSMKVFKRFARSVNHIEGD